MLSYTIILVTSVCGLFGAPVWTVVPAAVALSSLSYARHMALFRRAGDLGMQQEIDQTLVVSLFNSLLAAAAAFGLGVVLRVLS